jgi:hypothetical protein
MAGQRRPSKVKVAGYEYRITWAKHQENVHEDGDADGKVIHRDKRIIVALSQHEEWQRETLLHEILHVCYFVSAQAESKLSTEEEAVRPLSLMLFQTLQSNPQLTRWLFGLD